MSPINIYLDQVFLINFTMDFFILWAAAKLGRLETSLKKMVLSACIGAGYAVMIFLPPLTFIGTILAKFLCSVVMVLVAYGPTSFRRFLKSAAYFYLVSFILGGAVFGSMYFFNDVPTFIETWNGIAVNTINFKVVWLLVGLFIAILIGLWGASYIRKNLQQGPWLVKVQINIFNKVIEADALVDTGNQLTDPITKEPVMVIEHKRLSSVLPSSLNEMLKERNLPPLEELLNSFSGTSWSTRIRLIPFSSLGSQNGMLIGFKPDNVVIKDGNDIYTNKKVVVAIYHRRLSSGGTYQALIHPEMLVKN